jgi:hypothetical protein
LGPCQDKQDRTEVGIHGGVGGAVSGDGEGIGEPHGETGGDDGVGWIGQVISIYRYVPFNPSCSSGREQCQDGVLCYGVHANNVVARLRV